MPSLNSAWLLKVISFSILSVLCTLATVSIAASVSAQQSSSIIVQPTELESQSGSIVMLRALDKITARITEIELAVSEETRFGTLIIKAKYCRTRPPIETPETFAYLEIDDMKRSGNPERVFEGWMVASSPALNALEHAVYDVWVINCKALEPATSN